MRKTLSVIIALFFCGTASAQIPNAGFETWTTTSGYDVPAGWDQLNSMTASMSTYTCTKGTPGAVGSSYIKLVSKTVTGMGVMPGVAVSGMIDMMTFQPKYGFPNTTRPVSLTGSWQYMGFSGDQGHVTVLLSKWNSAMNMRDTVAYADQVLSGMVMAWSTFTVPLTYRMSAMPDSAIILLSASGATPVNNSYLYVDNLAFTGTVPSGIASVVSNNIAFSVFPNPAGNSTVVNYTALAGGTVTVSVCDLSGKCVRTISAAVIKGDNSIRVGLEGLAKGAYLVRLDDGGTAAVRKMIVE